MSPPVITLTTDFGLTDEFAGVMKGVILSRCPEAQVVDISHLIDPQDILQAAETLDAAYPYFPKGSVHVVVVDPGVGSDRRILAAAARGHLFLGPDNGVLWPILRDAPVDALVSVTETAFFLTPVSATFHGRDIFAPVAASLAGGTPLAALGAPVSLEDIQRMEIPVPLPDGRHGLTGRVTAVDRFGNLITNIRREDLDKTAVGRSWQQLRVEIKKCRIRGISDAYMRAGKAAFLALMGSRNRLEVALCCGNAAERLGVRKGDPVRLVFEDSSARRRSSKTPPEGGSDRKGIPRQKSR
ncbi:MAG: SAM-dependent chlorinase/fluorinase [Deltaproteobacteria bacterium]|nr:SAM-dependent chlorinase/fluorinase [Deltaproteobacteria bacterium]MBW2042456.1 SAM-dependent chlorinase/fluorinase [Deltaproteobacteria bacterium]